MPRYATTLSDAVQEVLDRSTITDTAVMLPPDQLPRDLYLQVDKVLQAAGGKWNRKLRAHIFPSDPREILGLAQDVGEIIDERKQRQQFFTPDALARNIVTTMNIFPGMLCLEPSAGGGALARAMRDAGGIVDCIENDPKLVSGLIGQGFSVLELDFLDWRLPDHVPPMHTRIAMNPPFTKRQGFKHVVHAATFLAPGGILTSVLPASIRTDRTPSAKEVRALVESWHGTIVDLDEGAFAESGTTVATVLLTLNRPA